MSDVVYALFFVILLPEILYCQQFEDDLCTHASTGSQGVCKLITKCQQAIEQLRKYQRYPQMCGFQGTQAIVCCPMEKKRKPGEISYKKCREYSNYTIQIIPNPVNMIGAPNIVRNKCGHKVITLIVGGKQARRKEFPHMASIGYERTQGDIKWLCGGTIISEQYILTAAHCLYSHTFGPAKYVRIGVTNLQSESMYKQDIRVDKHIPHPDYKSTSLYNDIALLELERAAKMNPYSRPACLYFNHHIKAKKALATGWGRTQFRGKSSDDLLKVTLDLVDQQRCNSSYKRQITRRFKYGIVEDSQLCAGSLDDKVKDTCQGDSGGPLQIYHIKDDIKCMYDVIGITSFGKACGLDVAVYTRVSHFVQWIEDTVWPEVS